MSKKNVAAIVSGMGLGHSIMLKLSKASETLGCGAEAIHRLDIDEGKEIIEDMARVIRYYDVLYKNYFLGDPHSFKIEPRQKLHELLRKSNMEIEAPWKKCLSDIWERAKEEQVTASIAFLYSKNITLSFLEKFLTSKKRRFATTPELLAFAMKNLDPANIGGLSSFDAEWCLVTTVKMQNLDDPTQITCNNSGMDNFGGDKIRFLTVAV